VRPVGAGAAGPQAAGEVALSFAPVVKQAAPAVVNIYATRVVQAQQSPFADDPFFRQFFEALGPTEPRVQNSLGSGVIVAAEGIVVSNYHVVGQATEIKVVLNDRREYVADVILGDEETDLAILRLRRAEGLPYLPFRNSDEVEVGDQVLAIGNPFGVGQTVTSGIVSALGRNQLGLNTFEDFIQTDAAINPGKSGGPLRDSGGRLMGVNTQIAGRSGASAGIGFAIPVDEVNRVVPRLIRDGRITRPALGVSAASDQIHRALRLPDGVALVQVNPNGPAARGKGAAGHPGPRRQHRRRRREHRGQRRAGGQPGRHAHCTGKAPERRHGAADGVAGRQDPQGARGAGGRRLRPTVADSGRLRTPGRQLPSRRFFHPPAPYAPVL